MRIGACERERERHAEKVSPSFLRSYFIRLFRVAGNPPLFRLRRLLGVLGLGNLGDHPRMTLALGGGLPQWRTEPATNPVALVPDLSIRKFLFCIQRWA